VLGEVQQNIVEIEQVQVVCRPSYNRSSPWVGNSSVQVEESVNSRVKTCLLGLRISKGFITNRASTDIVAGFYGCCSMSHPVSCSDSRPLIFEFYSAEMWCSEIEEVQRSLFHLVKSTLQQQTHNNPQSTEAAPRCYLLATFCRGDKIRQYIEHGCMVSCQKEMCSGFEQKSSLVSMGSGD
jgi:hypothetical protein